MLTISTKPFEKGKRKRHLCPHPGLRVAKRMPT
jgi:hypothetical protein